MQKTALITGTTGQDGAYLAELLLTKGYRVIGGKRRNSSQNFWRLDELRIRNEIEWIEVDVTDSRSIYTAINTYAPDEIYNLAAQSFVATSFEQPEFTTNVCGLGVVRILDAITHINKNIKFYQASTSELFGGIYTKAQNEKTPFYPKSPYGTAKLFAHWSTVNYRESYNIFGCSGILFNHESPLRGEEFVTRKIIRGLTKIKYGLQNVLEVGNVEAKRDWGYAKDYVNGMYLMLQQEKADDYVLATNETHSIKELIYLTMHYLNIKGVFENDGLDFIVRDTENNNIIVRTNPKYFRPCEVNTLQGDPSKAKKILGWQAETRFEKLIQIMVEAEVKNINYTNYTHPKIFPLNIKQDTTKALESIKNCH